MLDTKAEQECKSRTQGERMMLDASSRGRCPWHLELSKPLHSMGILIIWECVSLGRPSIHHRHWMDNRVSLLYALQRSFVDRMSNVSEKDVLRLASSKCLCPREYVGTYISHRRKEARASRSSTQAALTGLSSVQLSPQLMCV